MREVAELSKQLSDHVIPQHARLSRDLVRRGARGDVRARRAASTGRPTCRGSSRSASSSRRSTTSTSTRRTSASSPSPGRTASRASTSPSAAAWAGPTTSRPPIRAWPTSIGYIPKDRLLDAADAVMSVQRDYGNRADRARARFKYTIDDKGLDWIKAEIERRMGAPFEPARPFELRPPTATASAGARPTAACSTSRCSSRTAASSTRPTVADRRPPRDRARCTRARSA